MNADPTETGLRVLRALDEGRREAIRQAKERGRLSQSIVHELAMLDIQAGRPARGRAGRIARKLHGRLSESQVQRILRTLSSVQEKVCDTGSTNLQETGT